MRAVGLWGCACEEPCPRRVPSDHLGPRLPLRRDVGAAQHAEHLRLHRRHHLLAVLLLVAAVAAVVAIPLYLLLARRQTLLVAAADPLAEELLLLLQCVLPGAVRRLLLLRDDPLRDVGGMVEAVARAVAARRHEAVAAEVGGVLLLVDRLLRHLWGRGAGGEVVVVRWRWWRKWWWWRRWWWCPRLPRHLLLLARLLREPLFHSVEELGALRRPRRERAAARRAALRRERGGVDL